MPIYKKIEKTLSNLEQTPTIYFRSGSLVYVGTSIGEIFVFDDNTDIFVDYFTCDLDQAISNITIYENLMACAYIDGNIRVYNLHNKNIIANIFHGLWHVQHMLFLDKETLIINYNNKKLYKEKLSPLKQTKSTTLTFAPIDAIHLIDNFLLLQYDNSIFALFDIKNYKLLNHKYITTTNKIKTATLTGYYLEIISVNNFSNIYNLCDSLELDSHILHNNITEAFALIEHNPILKISSSYKSLLDIHNKNIENALQYISTQNYELFSRVCGMLDYKKDLLLSLNNTYKAYPRFCELIEYNRFAIAFGLSVEHSYLQQTSVYKKLQNHLAQAFKTAQKYILNCDISSAKEVLNPFITIPSKRESIKLFLEQNELFLEFFKAIEQNNFKKITNIIEKEKRFKKLTNYQIFIDTFPIFTQNILNKIYHGDDVKESLKKLSSSQTNITLTQISKDMQELLFAYKHNNFMACYRILDKNNTLLWCDISNMLEKHWDKLIVKARNYAKSGNIENISNILDEFINLSSRKEIITSIFKLCLYFKIDNHINKKEFTEAERAIYSYIDMFGKEYYISILMHKFEKNSNINLALH